MDKQYGECIFIKKFAGYCPFKLFRIYRFKEHSTFQGVFSVMIRPAMATQYADIVKRRFEITFRVIKWPDQ